MKYDVTFSCDIHKKYRFTEKQKNVKERLNISEKADSAQNAINRK